jgi:hypothetical protein
MIARPGLGTVMSATTGTIRPPRRLLAQLLILLAVAIASGVVALVIVSAVRHPSASAPQDAAPAEAPAPGKPPP